MSCWGPGIVWAYIQGPPPGRARSSRRTVNKIELARACFHKARRESGKNAAGYDVGRSGQREALDMRIKRGVGPPYTGCAHRVYSDVLPIWLRGGDARLALSPLCMLSQAG